MKIIMLKETNLFKQGKLYIRNNKGLTEVDEQTTLTNFRNKILNYKNYQYYLKYGN